MTAPKIEQRHQDAAKIWLEIDWMDDVNDPTYQKRAIGRLAAKFAEIEHNARQDERLALRMENDAVRGAGPLNDLLVARRNARQEEQGLAKQRGHVMPDLAGTPLLSVGGSAPFTSASDQHASKRHAIGDSVRSLMNDGSKGTLCALPFEGIVDLIESQRWDATRRAEAAEARAARLEKMFREACTLLENFQFETDGDGEDYNNGEVVAFLDRARQAEREAGKP